MKRVLIAMLLVLSLLSTGIASGSYVQAKTQKYWVYDSAQAKVKGNKLVVKGKRSIVSILTKKYLIASRQVLVCDNDPAVFLTKAIDLPENSDPCHPYDLGFLTANIQNNRMV